MFRVIDHTADIGLLIEGKSKEELFTESAAGMFSIIAGGKLCRGRIHPTRGLDKSSPYKGNSYGIEFKIKVTAKTLEELLVSFLNELLYLAEKEKAIFAQFKIKIGKIKNRFCLKGKIKKNSQIPKREIKAATYHNLKVLQKKPNLWQTRIIFDL
ncbi:MAG: archease [Candidatus Omnitrophica bacterium]|nr:archease [Candidatus Omnitrophota bacterium]